MLAGLAAADAVALLCAVASPSPRLWGAWGLVHALLGAAALALAARGDRFRPASPWLALLGAGLGPAGVWTGLRIAPRAGLRTAPPPPGIEDGAEPESGIERLSAGRLIEQRARHAPADRIGSLVAALRHGTLADRQAAVEAAVASFEPRLSPLIARALTDRDQTVRALAASASAQAIQRLAARRQALAERIAGDAGEASEAALGLLLADHARHNVLLSEAQRARMAEEARGALRRARVAIPADDPRQAAIAVALGEDARSACERLFAARDYVGLRARLADPALAALPRAHPLREVAAFWGVTVSGAAA